MNSDPRITQYALGELHGPEREAFEQELARSEDLQNQLNETLNITDLLGKMPMTPSSLTRAQKADLRSAFANSQREKTIRKWVVIGGGLAAAASFAILLMMPAVSGSLQKHETVLLADSRSSKIDVDVSNFVVGNVQPEEEVVPQTSAAPVLPGQKEDLLVGNELAATTSGLVATTAPAPAVAGEAKAKDFAGGWATGAGVGAAPARARQFADEGMLLSRRESEFNTEAYDSIEENVFLTVDQNPLSTFSIDVDTASYANLRRFLMSDQLPPTGAVRTEELLNYFKYDYPQPGKEVPFSVTVDIARAPWAEERGLVRVGLKGRELAPAQRPASNLVFLVDVSGSMQSDDKLPLLKRSLQELVKNLGENDRVAIAVYAGSSGLVLPSTSGAEKEKILAALENLEAGGSTNGAEGIRLAYDTARHHFLKEGNNRVILCTDGDFNVGVTNQSELVDLIEKERASGVFLSVLGFGTGNLKDSTMEKLANKGNGNYAYIDSFKEGRKVLVEEMAGTLFTIAKDVKIQVEFNPARVAAYRLIGYENRLLAKEDFNNDRKDAGEIGAGHTVTALYEIIPAGQPIPGEGSVDPLKYQKPAETAENRTNEEILTVKLRYKAPDGDTSRLLEFPLKAKELPAFESAPSDFQFAAAVAAFGMKLRGSPEAGDLGWKDIQSIARKNLGEDPGSHRAEFLTLVERAAQLQGDKTPGEE